MKIVDGFKMREVCGEYVVVPEGAKLVNFNKMLSLNGTAAFLWKSVEGKEFDEDTLVNALLNEYSVDEEKAREDVKVLIDKWIKLGVVK